MTYGGMTTLLTATLALGDTLWGRVPFPALWGFTLLLIWAVCGLALGLGRFLHGCDEDARRMALAEFPDLDLDGE